MSLNQQLGVAIVGCGTVGNATAQLLVSQSEYLQKMLGKTISVEALVSVKFKKAKVAGLNSDLFEKNIDNVLKRDNIHLVVETIGGVTAAKEVIEKSLKAGKHVVTANKALLAHHGQHLFELAHSNNVCIGFESSCAGGIPIIRTLSDGLSANRIEALYGILNGTSNFILTAMMEHGMPFETALKQAQNDGLAEADPTFDIDGTDAAHKLTLLATLAFGGYIPLESISVEGIDKLDLFDVHTGNAMGYVIKMVAFARNTVNGLETAVKPVFLPKDHPLSLVSGPFNAISVYGHAVGHTMYYGRGAGGLPTASAVVSDIISIAVGNWQPLFKTLPLWSKNNKQIKLANAEDSCHRHYMRFDVKDQSGVIAQITEQMARRGISVNSLVQKEYHEGDYVPVVIITHETRVKHINEAFEAIKNLPSVGPKAVKIRIIDEHAESL